MLLSDNVSYFLKSYLREFVFEKDDLVKLTSLSKNEVENLLHNKNYLCEPDRWSLLVNELCLDPQIAWQAYFNSVFLLFNEEPRITLFNYNSIEAMVKKSKENRKLFKNKMIPGCEVDLFTMKRGLNSLTFKDRLDVESRYKDSHKMKVDTLKKIVKLPAKRISELLKGQLPTLTELEDFVYHYNFLRVDEDEVAKLLSETKLAKTNTKKLTELVMQSSRTMPRSLWINAYITSIISKYKLNFFTGHTKNEVSYNLLDKIYRQK